MQSFSTIDAYIAAQPENVQPILQKLRKVIQHAAPQAEEAMRYGIPTFRLNGNLVHFGAFKTHIGFYPTPEAITHFAVELRPYKQAKGSVQFPLETELPYELIEKIVQFRVEQILMNQH